MEMPQPRVADRHRKPSARMHVLRKSRVIRGGERDLVAHAELAHRQADRALGGDVHGVRQESCERFRESSRRIERQPDLRIGRARNAHEAVGPDHLDRVSGQLELAQRVLQRHDHAVDLRRPGVSGHQYAQVCSPRRLRMK